MKKWTKETAEKKLGNKMAENKMIIIDGTLTLGQCSAADYLVANHGYRTRVITRG